MAVEDRPEGARIVRHWNERGRAAMLDLVIIIVMVRQIVHCKEPPHVRCDLATAIARWHGVREAVVAMDNARHRHLVRWGAPSQARRPPGADEEGADSLLPFKSGGGVG